MASARGSTSIRTCCSSCAASIGPSLSRRAPICRSRKARPAARECSAEDDLSALFGVEIEPPAGSRAKSKPAANAVRPKLAASAPVATKASAGKPHPARRELSDRAALTAGIEGPSRARQGREIAFRSPLPSWQSTAPPLRSRRPPPQRRKAAPLEAKLGAASQQARDPRRRPQPAPKISRPQRTSGCPGRRWIWRIGRRRARPRQSRQDVAKAAWMGQMKSKQLPAG